MYYFNFNLGEKLKIRNSSDNIFKIFLYKMLIMYFGYNNNYEYHISYTCNKWQTLIV